MKDGIARSPLFYVGDKYKLIKEIRTHFPPAIKRFIEPFVGGGSVFLNVEAEKYLLNDIDQNVISIHQMLCSYSYRQNEFFESLFSLIDSYGLSLSYLRNDIPDDLKKAFPKSYFAKYNKEAYAKMKRDYNTGNIGNKMMLYVLLIYGFNRMLRFNSKGEFNLPVGDVDFNKNTFVALDDYLRLVKEKPIEWYNTDFNTFLNGIDYCAGDLIYLDPPYLISSSEYNKLWNEENERGLLAVLDKLSERGTRWAISNVTHYKGKVNELFLNWSNKYNSFPIKSNYISFNDNSVKKFNEVLITNY